MGQEDVRGRGSVGAEGDNLTMGSGNTVKTNVNNCICYDVLECCRMVKGLHVQFGDFRAIEL